MNLNERKIRGPMIGLAILATMAFTVSSCFADTIRFPTSDVLPLYSVISVGPGNSFNANSGPIVGATLFGNGTNITAAQSQVDLVHLSNPVTGSCGTNPVTPTCFGGRAVVVPSSVAVQAGIDARALSQFAAGLPDTRPPVGTLSGVITADGPVTVIKAVSAGNNITFRGTPDDIFVINLTANSNALNTSQANWQLDGVLASHILWNFLGGGTGNNPSPVIQTSGGNTVLVGTFLLAGGVSGTLNQRAQMSNFSVSEGQYINTTGAHTQWNSGSRLLAFAPFSPPEEPPFVIPEPSTFILLATGLGGIVGATRRKLRL
jgi:hypothetical protein